MVVVGGVAILWVLVAIGGWLLMAAVLLRAIASPVVETVADVA